MSNLAFPYMIDSRGRSAEANESEHIRQLIEQVLFTNPGERVNRPDFGAGIMQFLFAPGNDELAAAAQFLIQGALQQWLGDVIQVEKVDISSGGHESEIKILIQYVRLRDQQRQLIELNR